MRRTDSHTDLLQFPLVLCPPRAAGSQRSCMLCFPFRVCTRELAIFLLDSSVSCCELSSTISFLRLSAPLCPLHTAGLGGRGEPAQESRLESIPRSQVLALQPGGDCPKLMSLSTPLQPANSLPDCSRTEALLSPPPTVWLLLFVPVTETSGTPVRGAKEFTVPGGRAS